MSYAGELVALRAREPGDGPLMHAWQSDPDTMTWWDRVYPPLPADLFAQRFAALAPPSYDEPSFMVVDKESGTPVGWCGLHHPSPRHRHAELAVLIGDRSHQGRGYGTDAVRTLCRFGFERMNLARITLTVFPGNTRARAVYERLGFAEEGVQRRAMWRRGDWHDLVHMAVFPETLVREDVTR